MEIGRLKKKVSLHELASLIKEMKVDCQMRGSDIQVNKVCSIKRKEEGGLYYLTAAVASHVDGIHNSIIIASQDLPDLGGGNSFLIVSEPQVVYYRLCKIFFPIDDTHQIHSTAIIHPEARIASGVSIGPYSVIGKSEIGRSTIIHSHVVIYDSCMLGENVTVEANSCIGATGVAWIWDEKGDRIIQPQVGGVWIGDGCFIGTDVTVVRGSLNEYTRIGDHTLIAHGTKIGHGCNIGSYCHFANNVSIAGSAVLGDRCFLGAGSVISSNIKLAENIIVGAGAVVVNHFDEGNIVLAGVPAKRKSSVSSHKGVPGRSS